VFDLWGKEMTVNRSEGPLGFAVGRYWGRGSGGHVGPVVYVRRVD